MYILADIIFSLENQDLYKNKDEFCVFHMHIFVNLLIFLILKILLLFF